MCLIVIRGQNVFIESPWTIIIDFKGLGLSCRFKFFLGPCVPLFPHYRPIVELMCVRVPCIQYNTFLFCERSNGRQVDQQVDLYTLPRNLPCVPAAAGYYRICFPGNRTRREQRAGSESSKPLLILNIQFLSVFFFPFFFSRPTFPAPN